MPTEAAPDNARVTLIGDSIGIDVTPYLKALYPNLNAEAKEGRQFYEAKTVVRQLLDNGKLAPTVVFVLGSNGLIKESLLKELIDMIGSDRKIVFVNTQVPRSWCEGVNETLTNIVAQYPNTIIADWYTASIGKDDYFYNDNVHPNPAGSKIMAQVIAGAITAVHAPTDEELAAAAAPVLTSCISAVPGTDKQKRAAAKRRAIDNRPYMLCCMTQSFVGNGYEPFRNSRFAAALRIAAGFRP